MNSIATEEKDSVFSDFTVRVNGRPVPVHTARVSAVPFNQIWPGYQRPLDQTELAGFACWDMDEPVDVEIDSRRPIESLDVRPLSYGIQPVIEGQKIRFRLEKPGFVSVEVNGPHGALHLFASPFEGDLPAPGTPGVRYFGPGEHDGGKIELRSNETVYIAAGAVVYGGIAARDAENVRVLGRGILDGSRIERGGPRCLNFVNCRGVKVSGIVVRDANEWTLTAFRCRDVKVSWLKLVGLWRYNADGIDICNSEDVKVEDCFVRSFDDNLVIKGLQPEGGAVPAMPVRNVRFARCVLWNDWNCAIEIGAETQAPEIGDIVFEDCDIVRVTGCAIDIAHGDRASVHDIRFQDIRVEMRMNEPVPRLQERRGERYESASMNYPALLRINIRKNYYSKDRTTGVLKDIVLRNISILGSPSPWSRLEGLDAEHCIENVRIENMRNKGLLLNDLSAARIEVKEFVSGLDIVCCDADEH